MTKFARSCMQKVTEITQELEVSLGPGTGNLRMRFGLHSGPGKTRWRIMNSTSTKRYDYCKLILSSFL
jgi:hypothetical protein